MQSEWQNLANLFIWSLLTCFTGSYTHSFLPSSLSHTNSVVFVYLLDIYNSAMTAASAWVLTPRVSSRLGISRPRACTHVRPWCSKHLIYWLHRHLSQAILGAVTLQLPFCISASYLMKWSVVAIWFCLVLQEANVIWHARNMFLRVAPLMLSAPRNWYLLTSLSKNAPFQVPIRWHIEFQT